MRALGVDRAQAGDQDLPTVHVAAEGQVDLVQGRLEHVIGVVRQQDAQRAAGRIGHAS